MRVVTGDETGLIKVSSVEDKKVVARMGNQTRDGGRMVDGVVQLWDVHKQLEVSRMEPLSVAHELPRSIFLLNRAANATARLVTCCENGAVDIRALDEALENCTAHTDVTVKGPVSRMRGSHSGTKLGYGGKENELQLFDIAAEKVEWTAKNVPENFLRLRLPVWVTDLQFLRNSNDRKIAICTAYGQVRLYDVRAQRRPVMDAVVTDVSEQIRLDDGTRLTCMALSHDQSWAAVGDAQGELRKVDLATGKVFGKFRHIAGSVRETTFHPSPTHNFLAAGGLDRHVRVYDARKMTCISSIYAKQKINCLLFDSQPAVLSTAEAKEDEDWLGIQEAKAARRKQKRQEDAAKGLATENDGGDGEEVEEAEASVESSHGLSRKGYASGKKRKATSKKTSPAKKKAVSTKKKK